MVAIILPYRNAIVTPFKIERETIDSCMRLKFSNIIFKRAKRKSHSKGVLLESS